MMTEDEKTARILTIIGKIGCKNATAQDHENFIDVGKGYTNVVLLDILFDGKPATAICTVELVVTPDKPEGTFRIAPMFISTASPGVMSRLVMTHGEEPLELFPGQEVKPDDKPKE